MTETKALRGVEIKSADEGVALVKFAAYDEMDHHSDITRKGAFEDGAEVVVSAYNHQSWKGALPVGKGVIREGGDMATAELKFFMDIPEAVSTFKAVKGLGSLQQWSYGFDVEKSSRGTVKKGTGDDEREVPVRYLEKLKVYEVSPVLLGAGLSTQTLAVKDRLESGNLRVSEESELVLTALKGFVDRAEEIVALRTAEGKKGLSDSLHAALSPLKAEFERITAILDSGQKADDEKAELQRLALQLLMEDL